MKILSLFDGISCGRLALERAGIPVEKYYASEIDKYAIQVAQKNYPDTIQVGDVTKLNYLELLDVDMVIGGSPCQDLSIAKQNRQGLRGERSGLFWKYVEALEVIRPKWFLLENVASMRNEDRDAITETLKKIYPETECIMINSALVSAQQRKRYYWTNWHVEQPQDKGILLKDILESGKSLNDKSHCLDANYHKGTSLEHYAEKRNREIVAVPCAMRTREDELGKFKRLETKDDGKANSLTLVQTDSMVAVNIDNYFRKYGTKGKIMSADTEKTQCLTASMGCGGGNNPLVAEPVNINGTDYKFYPSERQTKTELDYLGGVISGRKQWLEDDTYKSRSFSQGNRVYSVRGKSVSLNANGGGLGAKTGLYKVDLPDGDYIIRKLTPVECERLQTLTSVKNKYIIHICSDNQKSYVSVENQNPKLPSVVGSVENDKKKELVPYVEQNSNANNLLLNDVVLPNVQVYIGENRLVIHYQNTVLLNASFAEILNKFPHLKAIENFARTFVLINTILVQTTNNGKVESQQKEINLIQAQNGNVVVKLCGNEIMPLVKYAIKDTNTIQKLLSATTLYPLSIKNTEQTLKILFYYVANVICSFIPEEIQKNCILNIQTDLGYTFGVSNTQRYKAIGNGWTVDVIAWIFSQLPE